MNIKKKVKKLLLSGKSQRAVARQLSLSRSRVNSIKQQIIQDKITWNKKQSRMEGLKILIQNCLLQNMPARQIHARLSDLNLDFSYSTVARFVSLMTDKKAGVKRILPGEEAKVFFIYAGKFIKGDQKLSVWIFLMKLTYSKYAYYTVATEKSFECFLNCHVKALDFFGGSPCSIKVNRSKAFNINDPVLKYRYNLFLKQLGIRLVAKNNRSCPISCRTEERRLKEQFLFPVLHKDYERLCRELKQWYRSEINLGIHPVFRKNIEREFLLNEKPLLTPLIVPPLKKTLI